MENQSAILITYYEEEKIRLTALIKECLEDIEGPDYLSANSYQMALYEVQKNLRILNNLEDNLFDDKEYVRRRISRFEKLLGENQSLYPESYLISRLQEDKALLEKMNAASNSTAPKEDSQILEKALSDFFHKRIKRFKLVLDNSNDFYLEFLSSGKGVKIVLPHIKRHTSKQTLSERELTGFKRLGFEMTTNNKLEIFFENREEKTFERVKFILINIVFKVLHHKEYTNRSFIEFR